MPELAPLPFLRGVSGARHTGSALSVRFLDVDVKDIAVGPVAADLARAATAALAAGGRGTFRRRVVSRRPTGTKARDDVAVTGLAADGTVDAASVCSTAVAGPLLAQPANPAGSGVSAADAASAGTGAAVTTGGLTPRDSSALPGLDLTDSASTALITATAAFTLAAPVANDGAADTIGRASGLSGFGVGNDGARAASAVLSVPMKRM